MDNFFILERLDRLEKLLIAKKEVLTFEETCDYTGISRSYLYKLTAAGNIPHSKPNGKLIFFERKKIVRWLLQNERKSIQEIETIAEPVCQVIAGDTFPDFLSTHFYILGILLVFKTSLYENSTVLTGGHIIL